DYSAGAVVEAGCGGVDLEGEVEVCAVGLLEVFDDVAEDLVELADRPHWIEVELGVVASRQRNRRCAGGRHADNAATGGRLAGCLATVTVTGCARCCGLSFGVDLSNSSVRADDDAAGAGRDVLRR